MKPISILLADDHELIRAGIRYLVEQAGWTARIEEVQSSSDAINCVTRENWDVVVLDINLPGRNGIDALRDIRRLRPDLPVLVLSGYPEEQYAIRAIEAGANGYLNKNAASASLVEALQVVLAKGRYVSPDLASRLIDRIRTPGQRQPHETLSHREDEIVRLIATGFSVGSIAERLKLSVKTVSTHRANALQKLGLANNAQMLRYAHDHGMIE